MGQIKSQETVFEFVNVAGKYKLPFRMQAMGALATNPVACTTTVWFVCARIFSGHTLFNTGVGKNSTFAGGNALSSVSVMRPSEGHCTYTWIVAVAVVVSPKSGMADVE
jgi:hypothetical protein